MLRNVLFHVLLLAISLSAYTQEKRHPIDGLFVDDNGGQFEIRNGQFIPDKITEGTLAAIKPKLTFIESRDGEDIYELEFDREAMIVVSGNMGASEEEKKNFYNTKFQLVRSADFFVQKTIFENEVIDEIDYLEAKNLVTDDSELLKQLKGKWELVKHTFKDNKTLLESEVITNADVNGIFEETHTLGEVCSEDKIQSKNILPRTLQFCSTARVKLNGVQDTDLKLFEINSKRAIYIANPIAELVQTNAIQGQISKLTENELCIFEPTPMYYVDCEPKNAGGDLYYYQRVVDDNNEVVKKAEVIDSNKTEVKTKNH